jgi:hypothetical protein
MINVRDDKHPISTIIRSSKFIVCYIMPKWVIAVNVTDGRSTVLNIMLPIFAIPYKPFSISQIK